MINIQSQLGSQIMIIIEGIDASGKSTLGEIISRELGYTLVESEGPPKYKGEVNHRIERYLTISKAVFVRHPAVSQLIYARLRNENDDVDPLLLKQVYDQCNLFIYCDPLSLQLKNHVIKDGEDPQHIKQIEEKYEWLLTEYRKWAMNNAHVIYRIGDSIQRIVRICSTIK